MSDFVGIWPKSLEKDNILTPYEILEIIFKQLLSDACIKPLKNLIIQACHFK
jgi:hypothetical protein